MPNIILIRHAQASLGKSNYDELSELGLKQASLLGEYLKRIKLEPATIITGSMVRHKQTANQIIKALPGTINQLQDKDWNEFDFKKLIHSYLIKHPTETPASGDIRAFFTILKKSMLAWSKDELNYEYGDFEKWDEFSARISRAASSVAVNTEKPTLVVSSGGAISMLLMHILNITPEKMIDINFQIRNTSFTEIISKPHKKNLVAFNQINHLIENCDEAMITYA
jgi:broad specificity phosphatase PhoE